tara:strand:+ start:73 stop:324 length:252 start_codon:yes stop_codon:yes gene_type:complete
MQDTNNKNTAMRFGAMLVALVMIVAILAVYLFPWSIPIFWDMPENTTLPYYGLLLAVEMAPATYAMKTKMYGSPGSSNHKKGA